MEQHPVPQNILAVEFKLFGSFTLKQFAKIVIGCLGAVVIFFLPLPILIKLPFMFASAGTGITIAIIPNFNNWLNGFLKALFISPRYIWIKTKPDDSVLNVTKKNLSTADQNLASLNNSKKIDINDLPLEQLFASRTKQEEKVDQNDMIENQAKAENFVRLYSDVFKDVKSKLKKNSKVKNLPKPDKTATQLRFNTLIEYREEIEKLKFQLSKIPKNSPEYPEEEQKTMELINELFREVRILQTQLPSANSKQSNQTVVNAKGEVLDVNSQIMFGIVVDKKDTPISGVKIEIRDSIGNSYSTITNQTGKFQTDRKLPSGEYIVALHHDKHKFHNYKIPIGEQRLPAFKFRAR